MPFKKKGEPIEQTMHEKLNHIFNECKRRASGEDTSKYYRYIPSEQVAKEFTDDILFLKDLEKLFAKVKK